MRRFGGPALKGSVVLVTLAVLFTSTGGMALAQWVKYERVEKAAASARLVKVLEADCR